MRIVRTLEWRLGWWAIWVGIGVIEREGTGVREQEGGRVMFGQLCNASQESLRRETVLGVPLSHMHPLFLNVSDLKGHETELFTSSFRECVPPHLRYNCDLANYTVPLLYVRLHLNGWLRGRYRDFPENSLDEVRISHSPAPDTFLTTVS
jgi:hypothetical protein